MSVRHTAQFLAVQKDQSRMVLIKARITATAIR